MFHIRVERLLQKEIHAVFDALSDHAHYDRFPGIDTSVLLTPGVPAPNGLGARRRIGAGPIVLVERITGYERPTRLQYQIEKATPLPFRHDRGEITLTPEGDATRVTWESVGHARFPLLGTLLLDPLTTRQGTRMFNSILKAIERSG